MAYLEARLDQSQDPGCRRRGRNPGNRFSPARIPGLRLLHSERRSSRSRIPEKEFCGSGPERHGDAGNGWPHPARMGTQARPRRPGHHGHGDARRIDGARSHTSWRLRLHPETLREGPTLHGRAESARTSPLEALGGALDLKDAETEGHSKRVTAYTIAIAKAIKVDPGLLPQIARAAFLHDIGKMAIPDMILRKPGPLTPEEREVMRTHCEIGFNMVTRIPFLREAAEIVLSHQEYFDGTGYPRGLRGEQIPLGARIFAVADALDAMISDRPYRKALPISHAREEIQRCSGTQFDPTVVEVFLAMPGTLWNELRENIGRPYRLSQQRTV